MKDSGASIFCPCLCTEGTTKASVNSNRGKIRSAWEKISDSLHPHLPTGQQSTFRTFHHSTCDLLKAAAELWCRLTPSCIVSRRTLKGHPRSSCQSSADAIKVNKYTGRETGAPDLHTNYAISLCERQQSPLIVFLLLFKCPISREMFDARSHRYLKDSGTAE